MREELEEARERRFWGAVLRALGISFVVLAVLGALSALSVLLGWSRHLLPSAVGLLAGEVQSGNDASEGRNASGDPAEAA